VSLQQYGSTHYHQPIILYIPIVWYIHILVYARDTIHHQLHYWQHVDEIFSHKENFPFSPSQYYIRVIQSNHSTNVTFHFSTNHKPQTDGLWYQIDRVWQRKQYNSLLPEQYRSTLNATNQLNKSQYLVKNRRINLHQ